ncbi:hypothetical protein CFP71_00760 [Amycolatopsis thailandensis]|uniref:Uncharacterized protein n=1 Tax=Amycolatopsis thailandensis TaxID=589330 RepID=A0A229SJB1_9PSEU|nr:hypothetical protein CFP71_00760 [Amycolatopsis thailandensis]
MPSGPLSELKTLLHRLHVEAGVPSLDVITSHIRADDELPGSPNRDSVHRILRDPVLPPSQADTVTLATVLARLACWDTADAAARTRDLWVAASLHVPPGEPLNAAENPFALEVHRPVTIEGVQGLPDLPPYVPRAHDRRLADLVTDAAGGTSGLAVLVAGSSAGKTRACWEALTPLREAGDWRLWHPDSTRPDILLHDLEQVAPRTVVWLNETQNYLDNQDGQRIAAALRALLADGTRAPVLVLGTLWPQHHDALTRAHDSQVRLLIDGAAIPVPDAFTGPELANMIEAARTDPRLAWAVSHAPGGRITQEVAGGPELLNRFQTAPPAAKALVQAAMDARRLGHRLGLPLPLLEQAAAAYLTDLQLSESGDDSLDRALAYVTRPAKGAPGPLTRIPARRTRRNGRAGSADGPPEYRLADYLDQWGRMHRADQVPGLDFWAAVADHGRPDDQTSLGWSAWLRGLYRDAAQLYKNAAAHGDLEAAYRLVEIMGALHPGDSRIACWTAAQDSPLGSRLVSLLMTALPSEGPERGALARRVIANVDLNHFDGVIDALRMLRALEAREQAEVLAKRAADHSAVDDPRVFELLWWLRQWGFIEQMELLARRMATRAPLYHAPIVADLLVILSNAGETAKAAVLAERITALGAPTSAASAVDLLEALRLAGADEHVADMARSVAEHVTGEDRGWRSTLLASLHGAGAVAEMGVLVRRILADDTHADLVETWSVLTVLHQLNQPEYFETLARQALIQLTVDDLPRAALLLYVLHDADRIDLAASHMAVAKPDVVSWLLLELRRARPEQVAALAARAAQHTALDRADAVARLLDSLGDRGFPEQAAILARRAAADAVLTDHHGALRLLEAVRKSDADQATMLAERLAAQAGLETAIAPGILLEKMHELGYLEEAGKLAARAAECVPVDAYGLDGLVNVLRSQGATGPFEVLTRRLTAAAHLEDVRGISDLLTALWAADAHDEFAKMAGQVAASVSLDDAYVVDSLLSKFGETAALRPFTVLASRVAMDLPLENNYMVAKFLSTLREMGTAELFAILTRRVAEHFAVDKPFAAMKLLNTLRDLGAVEQFFVLAGRMAGEGAVEDPEAMSALLKTFRETRLTELVTLLAGRVAEGADVRYPAKVVQLVEALQELGETEPLAVLAWRAAAGARLSDSSGLSELLNAMPASGCDAQAAALTERLAAEGYFDLFLTRGENRTRFRFGREPDGTEAPRWSWADLD